jgi:hypothetical protein
VATLAADEVIILAGAGPVGGEGHFAAITTSRACTVAADGEHVADRLDLVAGALARALLGRSARLGACRALGSAAARAVLRLADRRRRPMNVGIVFAELLLAASRLSVSATDSGQQTRWAHREPCRHSMPA